MPKEIIFNGNEIINATDYKAKAEKVIAELGKTVFAQFEGKKKQQEFDNKAADILGQEKDTEKPNRPQKFYKNQINPVLNPAQVETKLNMLLRVYRPFTAVEAKTISDLEYLEAYKYYCQIIMYINDYLVYLPSKQTYCAFVNILAETYNEFMEDPNYSQVFKGIDDSFVQGYFNAAQSGIVDNKITLAKLQTKDAGHNLVRNPEALTINNYNQIDKQQVNLKLAQFDSLTKQIGNGKGTKK